MLKHFFIQYYRNIRRDKTSFFINITGLTTGLVCVFFIYLWVHDEMHVDKFHKNDDRLYQVSVEYFPTPDDPEGGFTFAQCGQLAEDMEAAYPEIEYSVDVVQQSWFGKNTLSYEQNNMKGEALYANRHFFKVFSFNIINGDKNNALSDKNNIAISDDMAIRLFGTTDNVIGKPLQFEQEKTYTVSAIFKSVPVNSTMRFDFVLSSEIIKEQFPYMYSYNTSNVYIYTLFKENVNVADFNKKAESFLLTKNKEYYEGSAMRFLKFSDTYLYDFYSPNGGRIAYVKLFCLIAVLIIVIACINFMNLSTAQSFRKIKELGIKKAVGASRKYLINQCMGETMAHTFMALLLALVLVYVLLPVFNELTAKQAFVFSDPGMITWFITIAALTGILAGSYPAFYLSGFRPALVLKGKLKNVFGEIMVRKGLVVLQFTLSISLIIGVFIIYKQIQFIQTKNLGLNKENIIFFEREGAADENIDLFISELKEIPGVKYVSSAETQLFESTLWSPVNWAGKTTQQQQSFVYRNINYDMIELMGLEIAEGRSFSRDYANEQRKVIFNEAAIAYMDMKDPIGKKINFWGADREIIGVVKDFQFQSLHSKINPVILNIIPGLSSFIFIKFNPGVNITETISNVKGAYAELNPGFPLNFRFADDDYQKMYESEIRIAALSKYFAIVAIIISCLGLFGLAAFTAQRRTKEVGVRKVLGSSELGIVYLLSGEFTSLVISSIVIALPLGYLFCISWLDNFEYKIRLHPWYFIQAAVIALAIAWVTVGMHAFKSANLNPSKCLRDE